MEVYGSFIKNFGCSAKFQFPTGWNSTEPADDRKVEIPFQFPTGWNSTFYHWSCRRMYPVSIPNGMEFYWWIRCILAPLEGVSIPNGMEFYRGKRKKIFPFLSAFQFPTGWNSTEVYKLYHSGNDTFQFPTGWNSTHGADFGRKDRRRFQFPTGWNSTFKDI